MRWAITFLLIGFLGIVLFQGNSYPPIVVSFAVFLLVACFIGHSYREGRIGLLSLLFFLVYALPFVHIIPYLRFDFEAAPPMFLWGLVPNPYMTNKLVIELMAMIGAVGAIGIGAGVAIGSPPSRLRSPAVIISTVNERLRTISLFSFVVLVSIAILLSWLSAPQDTLFTAAYTESRTLSVELNFASAWMLSYAILVFVLADLLLERSVRVRKSKSVLILLALTVIVFWFQLLRGERESLPLVVAMILMYYGWGRGTPGGPSYALPASRRKVTLFLGIVLLLAYLIGAIRHALSGVETLDDLLTVVGDLSALGVFRIDNLLHGTWSAVLLTPLSVAGDHINDVLPLKLGQTYLDIVSSLVPGFVADWFGYVRPIDAYHGPAWDMTYGLGGTHAVVVPFIDFRMSGVFVSLFVWGILIVGLERFAIAHRSVVRLALLGMVATALPHGLWYGEKYMLNALIMWGGLALAYSALLFEGARSSIPERTSAVR